MTNGAYKEPDLYALTTEGGAELAYVRRTPGGWAWSVASRQHGIVNDLTRAKDLAREEVKKRQWRGTQ